MKTNNNTSKVEIVNKQTTEQFRLLARPNIAPQGRQLATITQVAQETGTKNGKEFVNMVIMFQLETKDAQGKNYELSKVYNIADSGRGRNLFLKDYLSMTGTELTTMDLYDFDPSSMKNMRAGVEVKYVEAPRGVMAVIGGLFSATEIQQAAAA